MFSEKLDWLMRVTKTRNNILARAVSLDASHVSRLRRGGRALPKNKRFLGPMSLFFARRLAAGAQHGRLLEPMGVSAWPDDEASAARLLCGWLSSDEANNAAVADILRRFAAPADEENAPPCLPRFSGESCPYYYGAEGRRQAVLRLLAAVSGAPEAQTLLLFSQENVDWLFADDDFSRQWVPLLTGVLLRGNRVRIIHTINRKTGELLEAVKKWLPVYLTDRIEAYYDPNPRDCTFQRTLFIAPKTGALVSTSVHQDACGMLHFYVEDPAALAALERDFGNYLAFCLPMVQAFGPAAGALLAHVRDFGAAQAGSIVLRPGLSVMTMPAPVMERLAARAEGSLLPDVHRAVRAALSGLAAGCHITELVTLPTEEEIAAGRFPLPFSGPLRAPGLCYTREEYRLHLCNVLSLMERHENYRALLWPGDIPGLLLCGKADVGIFMGRSAAPGTFFAFSEPNLTRAFWDYLLFRRAQAAKSRKNPAAAQIAALAKRLGEA